MNTQIQTPQLANQSRNVAVATNKKTIKETLEGDQFKSAVAKVLPKHLPPDRFIRVAIMAMTRTPKLAQCDPSSFFKCLMDLSQYGLEPDGRRAHLIPFNNRKRNCVECQLIIDYKGIAELVMRSGVVSYIHADVVCDNDDFEYNRGEVVRHKINFKGERGEVYAVYAICRFKDGGEKCDVMSKSEVERIRNRSRAANDGPWVTDWNEMAKKTVFRRLSKWLPLSPEVRDAVEREDDEIETRRVEAAKPVFDARPALFELPQPEANSTTQAEDDIPMDFPASEIRNEPENPGPEKAQVEPDPAPKRGPGRPVQNFVKAIRGLLQLKGHTEAELLTFCRNTEKLDDSLSNLEEAFMVDEPGVRWIHDNWVTVDRELTRLKAEKVL